VTKEIKEKTQGPGPRISCVVPCLNAESYLASALDSLVAAAGPRDEIIAVYDHSADKTLQLLQAYAPKVRIITRHAAAPRGAAAALNDGFAAATGDVLCWLGADDYVFPWAFESVRSVFHQLPDVRWITSSQPVVIPCEPGLSVTARKLRGVSRTLFLDGFTVSGLRRGSEWIQQESTFWRRSLWEEAGGRLDERTKIVFDLELWSRFFDYAELYHVDCLLGAFRYRKGQLSGDVNTALQSARAVITDARLRSAWKRNLVREIFIAASHKHWRFVRVLALLVCPYRTVRICSDQSGRWCTNHEKFWIF